LIYRTTVSPGTRISCSDARLIAHISRFVVVEGVA
jgi:hypothetical protein